MKKQYFLYALMLLAINSWAQKDTKQQADKAYDQLSYLKAADLYQKLGESGLDEFAKIRLADSYRLNGDTESAEYWYAQAIQEDAAPEDILHYAQVLQSNNKCEIALNWYNQYRALAGATQLIPRAAVTDCANLIFLPKQQVAVANMRELNSAHLDYSPIPYKGGLVFTSTRGKGEDALEDTWTKDNFSDLFFAKKINEQSFTEIQLLAGNINGDFHDGTATFNKTGTVMYFSRNNYYKSKKINDAQGIMHVGIFSADLIDGEWDNIQSLNLNNPNYIVYHPSLSKDGKRLYELARKGETTEIKARTVTISEFEITKINFPEVEFRVVCSKGTYIRSLAYDFGLALNSGAHLSALRRTKIGDFSVEKGVSIEDFISNLKVDS
mgnify:CR=1 FL=1